MVVLRCCGNEHPVTCRVKEVRLDAANRQLWITLMDGNEYLMYLPRNFKRVLKKELKIRTKVF